MRSASLSSGLVVLSAFVLACTVSAQRATVPAPASPPAPPRLGDQTDGSRARPVHRIPLRDSEGEVIRPTDRPLLPFSTSRTCGECHDVATVGRGWHFNVMAPGATTPRPGEPWILVDPDTATQLPLSYQRWPGTFRPEQVGLTPWAFTKQFGGRTPGGLTGSREPTPDLRTRWLVSGDVEPNCLACHDNSAAYDHAEFGRQITLENFRWAAAGASGLAIASGAAREMPNSFDYLMPTVEDALRPRMPSITYATDRFLPDAKVILDIVREVPTRRCYFCHSGADVAQTGQGRWATDVDVHVARGMTCVECHRNGLDHAMTRGYEGDAAARGSDRLAGGGALTCRGCHFADEPNRVFANGRAGAPYPRHVGLPPIHLEKLSCTACHSGPRPEAITRQLKTSQAHRLGGLNVNKAADALPHLYYPVFARQEDGTTTPNRMMWPAFWGRVANGTVEPLAPERVKPVMAKAKIALKRSPNGSWPALDEPTIVKVLTLLQEGAESGVTYIYVAGGRSHRLNGRALVAEDHPSAQPYLWPIAHDVRPASLALGARGCQDCHDASAPIFFGQVTVDSPLAADRVASWQMSRFQKGLDAAATAEFAGTFRYRSWLKGTLTGAVGILLLVVLGYAMTGLMVISATTGTTGTTRATRTTATTRWVRIAVNAIGAASGVAIVVSGWSELWSGQALTGARLMLHVTAAPVFVVSAVLVTLFWAHRNRFGRADWNRLRHPLGLAADHGANPYLVVLRKVSFWVAAIAVVPAAVSATLAMFPIMASVWQTSLFAIHRYAVSVLIAAAALFTLLALVAWIRRYRDDPDA